MACSCQSSPLYGRAEQASRRLVLIASALGLVAVSVSSPALAQGLPDAAASQRALDDIVVTGTRTEKARDDAPVRTEVISRQEIHATGARTLKEALSNIPGLQLQQLHGKSGYQLQMQGLGSDQILVLIDGMPISASTGSSVDLSQYLLSDVERVEVVKGAASAQYGSAAMGGVVNVITRKPVQGLHGALRMGLGSRGRQNDSGKRFDAALKQWQGEIGGGSQTLRGRLSLERVEDDGFAKDPSGWSRQGDRMRRDQVTGLVWWQLAPGSEVSAELGNYQEKDVQRSVRFVPPRRLPLRKTEDIDRNRLVLSGRHRFDHGSVLQLRGVDESYRTESHSYTNGVELIDRRSRQRMDHLGLQWDLPPMEMQSWQWGADLHREQLEQTQNGKSELQGNGDVSRSSHELYVQGDIFLSPALEVLPGLRWQNDSDFGQHWAPKLSARYQVFKLPESSLVLRASIGQGYRVPNLKERHFLFDHSALGYKVNGNPNLKPESSTSLQFGALLALGTDWTLDANAYLNRVKDLIQVDRAQARQENGVSIYSYSNVARARTHGIETQLTWHPAGAWRVSGALTLGKTRDLDKGGELTNRPRRTARLGVDWRPTSSTELTARVRHQSSELVSSASGERSKGWSTVDLGVGQKLGAGLEGFLRVENLLDKQRDFSDPNQFGPISGRLVMIGIKYGFSSNAEF